MFNAKMTLEQAVNLHQAAKNLSKYSTAEKYRELIGSKNFFRLSVVLKKTKDLFDSFAETELNLQSVYGTLIYGEVPDKDGKTKLAPRGYNLTENQTVYNQKIKEVLKDEVAVTDIFQFKLSQLHSIMSCDDYIAMEPIMINDMPEFLEGD